MAIDITGSDFQVETGKMSAKVTGVHESLLQECEKDIIWYRDNFFGKGQWRKRPDDANEHMFLDSSCKFIDC